MNPRYVFLPLFLAACASQPHVALYSLDVPVGHADPKSLIPATISVGRPAAQPGCDTARMAYETRLHQVDYFEKSLWVDTPDRMLLPILVESLSKRFATVVTAPYPGDMRLDTDILLLRQEFSARTSRIHLAARARISRDGKIISSREFEFFEACPENDPYGGVLAANRAVSSLVRDISDFCAAAY